jgi:hypothetical protein
MDTKIYTQISPEISGSDKKHLSITPLKFFYKKKKTGIINKKSIFDKINFFLLGHFIYLTGIVCGFLGFIIGFFKFDNNLNNE